MSSLENRIVDLAVAIGGDIHSIQQAVTQLQVSSASKNVDGGSAFATFFSGGGNTLIDGGDVNG